VEFARQGLLERHRKQQEREMAALNAKNRAVVASSVLKPGDKVLTEVREHERTNPYQDRWKGPMIVQEVKGTHVVIKPRTDSPPDTFRELHARRVKPYLEQQLHVKREEEEEEIVEVTRNLSDELSMEDQGQEMATHRDEVVNEKLQWTSEERAPVERLMRWDPSARRLKSAPPVMSLDHMNATLVKEVKAHRRNAVDGQWEFQVIWETAPGEAHANCSEDMWLKAKPGSAFIAPLKQYLQGLEEMVEVANLGA
jgi:hypothetical protein